MQQLSDLTANDVVGGRYRLIEAVASGGTASVWRAADVETDDEVAIKLLRDDGVDESLRIRARREARLLEDLDHPNLVRVIDSGEDGDVPYLVMELLDGAPLRAVLRERGAIPVDEAVTLVADVADGLGLAHERGVIHRDVKPANIVCHDDVPVLVDFGIARALDATTLTRGLVVGTAAYLAPEQAQGLPLTPACDVYALGCVLYELLVGAPPFQGDSPVAVAVKHVQESPVPPCDLAEVPAAVNAVVMRCLAKEPEARPADGRTLAAELRAAMAAGPDGDATVTLAPVTHVDGTTVMPAIDAAPVGDDDADLIDPSPLLRVPPPEAVRPSRRALGLSPVVVAGAFVLGLVLLGVAISSWLGGDDTRPVPDVTNAPVADATTYLEGAGLTVDIEQVPSDAPAGIVVASDPPAGEEISDDGTVTISVSTGPPPAPSGGAVADEGHGRGREKKDKDD